MMENLIEEMEPIYSYTRAQAIEDGVLCDVTETAKEAGFHLPVAITQEVWNDLNHIPKHRKWESFSGRLWDLLFVGAWSLRALKRRMMEAPENDPIHQTRDLIYDFILTLPKSKQRPGAKRNSYSVKIVIGPGDQGEPVITIMKPYED